MWASGQAANAQQEAARQAMAQQQAIYNQSRSDQSPYMQDGQQSLGDLMRMLQGGYNMNQLANDPGYQFQMQQGQKALERSAAAGGRLNSGAFMKGLDQYSQGLASSQFGQRFNRLATVAGMGQNSAQNLGLLGGNFANSMSQLYGAQGNAQAAGYMGLAKGFGGLMGSVASVGTGMPMGGGGYGGGSAPSASSLFASNPGNYSLGGGSLNIPPQNVGGY